MTYGSTAVAIVPLPLPPGAEARALLHHLLEHGDIVGTDAGGQAIIQLAVDDRVLEPLMRSTPTRPNSSRGPTRRRMGRRL